MGKKTKAAPPAPKVFETFKANVRILIAGEANSINGVKQMIEETDGCNVFRLDRLISLPAFVEEGVPAEHPRSRDRWASLMWNTLNPEIKLSALIERDNGVTHTLQIDFEHDLVVPVVRREGEGDDFRLHMELTSYFNDAEIFTCWKLTDVDGNVIYGLGRQAGLIQEQTPDHENAQAIFETSVKGISHA